MADIATVVGAFVAVACVLIVALILHGNVQPLHQAEEIGVTPGRHAVGTAGHKVIGIGIGVAAEFRQHIGPALYVVQHAVVAAVVKGAILAKFQTGKGQTGPGLVFGTFGVVGLNVIFPLAVAGHHIVNLGFAFKAQTDISLIAISLIIIRKIVQTIYFAIEI